MSPDHLSLAVEPVKQSQVRTDPAAELVDRALARREDERPSSEVVVVLEALSVE